MKKRLIAILLTAVMVSALMAGCGNKKGSSSGAVEADAPAADTAVASDVPSTDLTVEGDNVNISLFAGSIPENTPTGGALAKMADYINANSNGTVNAEAFYDTALGDATSMVQGLQQGTIDVGVSGTSYFSGLVPEIDVYQLPFLFEDIEEARKATESTSESAQAIFDKMSENGLVGLVFFENGFRELTNNVRAIEKPEDMEGIKMRCLPSDVQVATWEAMGALTATIDASELYTALQQGTVQAQDNPLHEIASRKFYEVQKYVTMTDAVYTPFIMAMSQTTYDSMSESQQDLVKEAAEYARKEQLILTDEAQATAKQTLIDNGCEIVENPDKAAFQKKAEPTWSIFTEQYGTEILDTIQK